jgi:DnaJ-domain-containing protein 1
VEVEGALILVVLVIWLICAGLKALFRLLTGAARREREEKRRLEHELRRQEEERERERAAKRRAKDNAIAQFNQAIMDGQLPCDEVLAVLAGCDDDILVNVKEAFEELLWGTCTLRDITYGEAVRLIRQRGRIGERAQQRAGRVGLPGDDPDRPLGEAEALALLGLAQGCTPDELADAYHRTVSQWHPDKLETMAPELREYATRRTARLNEAYRLIKPTTVHRRAG